jgi:hypothetical protein
MIQHDSLPKTGILALFFIRALFIVTRCSGILMLTNYSMRTTEINGLHLVLGADAERTEKLSRRACGQRIYHDDACPRVSSVRIHEPSRHFQRCGQLVIDSRFAVGICMVHAKNRFCLPLSFQILSNRFLRGFPRDDSWH